VGLPGKLYTAWAIIVFSAFLLLFLPFLLIPPMLGPRVAAIAYLFLKIWSWLFSKLTFIRYRIHGLGQHKNGLPCIYVSNHTSFLDLPGLSLAIPGQFRPLAKKELLKIPVFGWVVGVVTIIVDRTDAESRVNSLKNMIRILQMGIPALVFPEGTQNRTGQLLQPFKDGAFRMALETNVPVIPVVIKGAGILMPPGKMSIRPGLIHIQFGTPINPDFFASMSASELKKYTFEIMERMLKAAPEK
jgi:1-acyl-sn-glycerol-3-phosphate acyltransferase